MGELGFGVLGQFSVTECRVQCSGFSFRALAECYFSV